MVLSGAVGAEPHPHKLCGSMQWAFAWGGQHPGLCCGTGVMQNMLQSPPRLGFGDAAQKSIVKEGIAMVGVWL